MAQAPTQVGTPDHRFTSDPVDWGDYNGRWELIWGQGLNKGERWDIGMVPGALARALDTGAVICKGKRVVVPGCGRGYDVVTFAKQGANVTGLELAPTAAQAANENVLVEGISPEQGRVLQGNFFEYTDPEGPFDMGFDYTFGCAMHPTMRTTWATHWARLIKSGGQLLTLIFPIGDDLDASVGPPFPVSVQLYKDLLEPVGFECVTLEDVPPEISHPKRQNREKWGVWVRK